MQQKGKRTEPNELFDRFSELPDNAIDLILSRIPLRDAVRTSILSTKWRFHWTRRETLVLNKEFFDSVLGCGEEGEITISKYVDIVGNILGSHNGPLHKFFLHVPEAGDTPILDYINQWILSASRRRVKDLTIAHRYDEEHEFPLSVFQCAELKRLCLKFVDFEAPPHDFGEFSSLVILDLTCCSAPGYILTCIILKCPMLERLLLDFYCINNESGRFVLISPKLKVLSITYCYHIDFFLGDLPNLSTLSLNVKDDPDEGMNTCQDIRQFFGALTNVEKISLTGDVLAEWVARNIPERTLSPLRNHWSLTVQALNLCSLAQIRSLFFLINSSPDLELLIISVYHENDDQLPATTNYIRSQVLKAENLWSLINVQVVGFTEKEPGLILIQAILSCCPRLEKLYLRSRNIPSRSVEFKIMSDIMRFPRASTQAEIIYLEPNI